MMEQALRVLVMGITATVAIDLWATFANRMLGWPRTNWGMVGRWIGHMRDGQFTHVSIGSSPPIVHESILGWVFHYVVGCIYAALYLMFVSTAQWGGLRWCPAYSSAWSRFYRHGFLCNPRLAWEFARRKRQGRPWCGCRI